MKIFRTILLICAFIIIAAQLIIIDFTNLKWTNNAGSYLGIISMILVIVIVIISIRNDKR